MLDAAREALRRGQKDVARAQLEQVLENDEYNAEVWFLMSQAVDTEEEQRICLDNALQIDPNHPGATAALKLIDGGAATAELFGDFDPFADEGEALTGFASEDTFFDAEEAEAQLRAQKGQRGLLVALMVFFAIGTLVMVVVAILLATGTI